MTEQESTLRRRNLNQTKPLDPQPAETEFSSEPEAVEPATFGKTPDGTVFKIPQTHDMLSSLFDPRLPKSHVDIITLSCLTFQLILFVCLPRAISRRVFIVLFACFRLAYNAGLGIVLKKQSEEKWIVRTVMKRGWMDKRRNPRVQGWIKRELVAKMGKDYDFEALPIEFNVWIMFRHFVDVILLNDFLAYCFFGISFLQFPSNHSFTFHALRWLAGLSLVFFNLWVKVDAHRIVKDYAWYWGDAFFLSMQNLVFDGVFEFAPHPMYSVGYAGYYGLSLITASETVLFVSLAAHACQFGFLVYFENPHIERTYGSRKPLAARTPLSSTKDALDNESRSEDPATTQTPEIARSTESLPSQLLNDQTTSFKAVLTEQELHTRTRHDLDYHYFRSDLLVFRNFDIFRNADLAFALVLLYGSWAFASPTFTAPTQITLAFVNASLWRLFHSFVLGLVLKAQSEKKWIVRHFLKHYHYSTGSGAIDDAFANWKATYNLSLCMTYASFLVLAWRCYTIPADWTVGTQLVRHALGSLLILLHVWTAQSTYEALGTFGWFYGDFFIQDYPAELYYTGIFRFLNNPERSMGGAAFFGLVLICGSKLLLIQAVFAILSHWWFLSAVENPHMRKLYGDAIRKDAGVTKTVRNVVSRNAHVFGGVTRGVQEVQGTFEKVLEEAAEALETFLLRSKPRLVGYVEDTKILLNQSGENFVITRIAANLANFDLNAYKIIPKPSDFPSTSVSGGSLRYHLGEPIVVDWSAPSSHSKKDWIGIYRLGANKSDAVTRISSQGHWVGVHREEWNDNEEGKVDEGEAEIELGSMGLVKFSGKALPSKIGCYELRYHHDGKHNVLATSAPIEIFVQRPSNPDDLADIHSTLTSIVVQTLSCDPSVIPASGRHLLPPTSSRSSSDLASSTSPSGGNETRLSDPDDFVLYSIEDAQRVAYAIQEAFAVELNADVILAAANVERLAKSIHVARRLLGRPE